MKIHATIEKIEYDALLVETLPSFDLSHFNINDAPTACLVNDHNSVFAISKWVSPKRTRSYPYERIYNTLGISKKVTVIPIVKDEGKAGDRDYIQWDTVSLMSLLDVFVIFAYYDKADKAGSKIINQQFDNQYVISKIAAIKQFHSSALHWNLGELKNNFDAILAQVKTSYINIQTLTGVSLHPFKGLDHFRKKIDKDVEQFKTFSREKAEKAQAREVVTVQPKEALSTATKAKLTITNFLGGEYFLTVDEIQIVENTLYLIESKHTKNALLPSKSDIKDGLLKLILYCNFATMRVDAHAYKALPVLKLTSAKLKTAIASNHNTELINIFFEQNEFKENQQVFINKLFKEAIKNHFLILIEPAI
jgi:hypothetical protein